MILIMLSYTSVRLIVFLCMFHNFGQFFLLFLTTMTNYMQKIIITVCFAIIIYLLRYIASLNLLRISRLISLISEGERELGLNFLTAVSLFSDDLKFCRSTGGLGAVGITTWLWRTSIKKQDVMYYWLHAWLYRIVSRFSGKSGRVLGSLGGVASTVTWRRSIIHVITILISVILTFVWSFL